MSNSDKERLGMKNAAALLLALGEELAADVLQYLEPREVHDLGKTMARLDGQHILIGELDEVCKQFLEDAARNTPYAIGTDTYVRRVLGDDKVLGGKLGRDRAQAYIERILMRCDTRGLDELRWMEPRAVADAIRNEHPQIIALALAYLEPQQAAEVLAKLQNSGIRIPELIKRLSYLDIVQPHALSTLSENLERQLSGVAGLPPYQGVRLAGEIMNYLEPGSQAEVFNAFAKSEQNHIEAIRDHMFMFEDFARLAPRDLMILVGKILHSTTFPKKGREGEPDKMITVNQRDLIIALRGASERVREAFVNSIRGPVKSDFLVALQTSKKYNESQVEDARRKIIGLGRYLESTDGGNEITMKRSSGRMI